MRSEQTITFFGPGRIAIKTIDKIRSLNKELQTKNNYEIKRPISKIYLVGKNSNSSLSALKQLKNELYYDTIDKKKSIKIDIATANDLTDILRETNLFIITASNQPIKIPKQKELFRTYIAKANIPIIDELTQHMIGSKYEGIINIVSNLPEILAQYASTQWKLRSIKQLTANIPIDLNRYKKFLHKYFEQRGDLFDDFKCSLIGYHEQPIPLFNGVYGISKQNNKTTKTNLTDILNKAFSQDEVRDIIKQESWDQFQLLQQSGKKNRGPTDNATAKAIKDYVTAFLEQKTTITGIPHIIGREKRIYFVNLPTTFKYENPELNYSKFHITKQDKKELERLIVGDYNSIKNNINELSLKEAIRITFNHDIELNPKEYYFTDLENTNNKLNAQNLDKSEVNEINTESKIDTTKKDTPNKTLIINKLKDKQKKQTILDIKKGRIKNNKIFISADDYLINDKIISESELIFEKGTKLTFTSGKSSIKTTSIVLNDVEIHTTNKHNKEYLIKSIYDLYAKDCLFEDINNNLLFLIENEGFVKNCSFLNNKKSIVIKNASKVIIEENLFENNIRRPITILKEDRYGKENEISNELINPTIIYKNKFYNNQHVANGGAIYSENQTIIKLNDFINNKGNYGGAIFFDAKLTTSEFNCIQNYFQSNKSWNGGNAIFFKYLSEDNYKKEEQHEWGMNKFLNKRKLRRENKFSGWSQGVRTNRPFWKF